jgi:hypothetical protein
MFEQKKEKERYIQRGAIKELRNDIFSINLDSPFHRCGFLVIYANDFKSVLFNSQSECINIPEVLGVEMCTGPKSVFWSRSTLESFSPTMITTQCSR